ncbi:hypothetical protein [Chitinophaga filiformis]|uniref:Uncharacterized protein n=1 Tax=Chitinophaga filiformis TaxID=104663 RepID=A0ABY4I033_CHIFI|nr:hypothetical protein [Chitinophaga filiformis]UPK68543.1 hypothetical protein MYF79_26660 [Chitinophaga filiformis]
MSTSLTLFFIVFFPVLACAETDSLSSKYVSIGLKKAGICFGNSTVYTGFRFNLMNKRVRTLNGFDLSLLDLDEDDNRTSNGVSLGVICKMQAQNNGLSIGGLLNAAERQNGVMLAAIMGGGSRLNGVGVMGMMMADTVNGLAISGWLTGNKYIGGAGQNVVNGMALTLFVADIGEVRGVVVAACNLSESHKGLAVGGINRTSRLRGVQIGLFNVALNNPRGLRRLPFINMHLGK